MAHLIPLRLQASADIRRIAISSPTSTFNPPATVLSTKPIDRPRPGPLTDRIILPYTEDEWREVMEEVKALYMRRRYKQCSARCIQILGSIRDPHRVHPLYQIYLSFFAASSLELTSRSLHPKATTKLPLLHESLKYYENASSYMDYAFFSANPTMVRAVRQARQNSISSVRSSISTVCSHASSISSAPSPISPSPISSICSSTSTTTSELTSTHNWTLSAPPSDPDTGLSPLPLNTQKVSFSLQLPRHLSEAELELASESSLLASFPSPPSLLSGSPSSAEESSTTDLLLSRASMRYRGHLSDLRGQLAYHIGSLKSQISALQASRKARRSNLPSLFTDFEKGVEGFGGEEKRNAELQARIAGLKENGWHRTRFDGSRYQALCEKAIDELDWGGYESKMIEHWEGL